MGLRYGDGEHTRDKSQDEGSDSKDLHAKESCRFVGGGCGTSEEFVERVGPTSARGR